MTFPDALAACAALGAIAALTAGCDDTPGAGASNEAPVPIAQQPVANPGAVLQPAPPAVPQGSGFDFYVLALSWSPSYCAAEGRDADRRQCGPQGPKGFVVHGLWPQFERGYPASCPTGEPLEVPRQLLSSVLDIVPSAGLAAHEWRKHGTCSGLGQADYFKVTREAWKRVRIPPALGGGQANPAELENAFIRANRGLTRDAIAVTCDRQYLREVQICLTKSLDFRPCPEVDRSGCRKPRAAMPAKR